MPTLSLRMEKEDLELLKEYSNINNLNMSSFVRNLILDKIYDEITEEDEKRILKDGKIQNLKKLLLLKKFSKG